MKRKKLLHKLADYLNLDQRTLKTKRAKMKLILKQLRDKERKLQLKAEHEHDAAKKSRLSKELDILRAQRLKGISVLKELK
ncbi:MAG: hypothetical protein OQK42_01220 [Sedimenticola sp.]|uniref:Uncharacterized protein n=1 Tax=Sedimenticola thiotaurini TaxID=1543721 RepID=A0A558D9D4_9GAMM|nr:hypothetical protein [Sedimenticola sp.]TVT57642.1 MAG: hypothetical protein FHK82_05540 [Sedimenticola thiotaurini]MCW8880694.1 hypothetical protein [Sedimenticola sp.]MCW8921967.1 hypothetical protein [Sedimenticola sp.]MCW8947354.1 hypothetical protein [Sedimenticola sp.]